MNNWKQPTPTDIRQNSNLDLMTQMIFLYVWNMVRSEDGVEHFIHAGREYEVELKRGQCILKVDQIAKVFKTSWRVVRKKLKNIEKWYTPMQSRGMPYGLILSFEKVDELLGMQNRSQNKSRIEAEQKQNRSRAKKSVKSVKNEKNVKRNTLTISKDMVADSEGKVLNSLIARFKPINPSYKQLFTNRTQRAAMKRMFSEHGEGKMIRFLEALPEVVVRPYAPRVTTPLQLESKFGELVVFMQQEKKKGGGVVYAND